MKHYHPICCGLTSAYLTNEYDWVCDDCSEEFKVISDPFELLCSKLPNFKTLDLITSSHVNVHIDYLSQFEGCDSSSQFAKQIQNRRNALLKTKINSMEGKLAQKKKRKAKGRKKSALKAPKKSTPKAPKKSSIVQTFLQSKKHSPTKPNNSLFGSSRASRLANSVISKVPSKATPLQLSDLILNSTRTQQSKALYPIPDTSPFVAPVRFRNINTWDGIGVQSWH